MGRPAGRQVDGPARQVPFVPARQMTPTLLRVPRSTGSTIQPLPKGFKVKGTEFVFVFYEERIGSNAFVFDRSDREAVKGTSALAKAPEILLLHPDIKEVPTPVSFAGAKAASA